MSTVSFWCLSQAPGRVQPRLGLCSSLHPEGVARVLLWCTLAAWWSVWREQMRPGHLCPCPRPWELRGAIVKPTLMHPLCTVCPSLSLCLNFVLNIHCHPFEPSPGSRLPSNPSSTNCLQAGALCQMNPLSLNPVLSSILPQQIRANQSPYQHSFFF